VHQNNDTGTSPCSIPLKDAVLPFDDLDPGSSLFKPTFIDKCYSSLPVNKTLMKAHIENLWATFAQYFCFYDIAKNVSASDPLNYQPELGYSLFVGPLEGQVDLDSELKELLARIDTDGASLATFWEIHTSFNKLYDAHVILPDITGIAGQLVAVYGISVFPERNFNATTRMNVTKMTPTYDAGGELELALYFQANNGTIVIERIATINGKIPYDFYMDMISKPELADNYPYQSIGARMNGAFKQIAPRNGTEAFRIGSLSRPTNILPDTFQVVYTSGKIETFYTGLSYKTMNASTVYGYVNSIPVFDTPGSMYSSSQMALSEIRDKKLVDVPMYKKKLTSDPNTRTDVESFDWDYVINLPSTTRGAVNGRMDVGAYKIEDDYAVLKIQSFEIAFDDAGEEAMLAIWANFSMAAKERGVTKAIIDISGNGGGRIQSANFLAALMYPSIPYEVFQNEYDITYNDLMQVYYASVYPALGSIVDIIESLSDNELQEYTATLTKATYNLLLSQVKTLFTFCCGTDRVCSDPTCQELADLGNAIVQLRFDSSGSQLRQVVDALIKSFMVYNPFNVLGVLETGDIDPTKINEFNRGGETVMLTNKFSTFKESMYNQSRAQSLESNFTFDEYVIVSDGKTGSSACIFSSMMMQVWNNQDRILLIPLTTVTYGGTKNPANITVAGFPASAQHTKTEVPIITSGLMYMLETLLPSDLASNVSRVNHIYQEFLPRPPYFADGPAQMPVYNYYSYFMGKTDAIPLQYVKMTADKHIPQIFNGNSLMDSSDLQSLYKQTAHIALVPR